MATKKKTDAERIKSVDEKFTIIIVLNFFLLIIMLMFFLGNQLENFEDGTNYNLAIENYELKNNISKLQMDLEILRVDIIECSNNNLIEIVEDQPQDPLKEIDCLVNRLEWDSQKQEYYETDWFEKAPKCYEVVQ